MFKRRIWILCVIVVLIIMTKHFGESKPKADLAMKPDVVSSISINQDQYLTVVANRSRIEDKEEFADLLIQMYKENSFQTINFSSDIRGYDQCEYDGVSSEERNRRTRAGNDSTVWKRSRQFVYIRTDYSD